MQLSINTYDEIITVLENSFGFEDFMRTINYFIEKGIISMVRNKSTVKEWRDYWKRKEEIKQKLKAEFEKENPDSVLRGLKLLINVYDVSVDEIFEISIIKKLKQEIEFEKRINQLK